MGLTHPHPDQPADPGWMPGTGQDAPFDITTLPPPEGFHWDPVTHIPVPNAVPDAGTPSWEQTGGGDTGAEDWGPGDYPEPDPDTGIA